MSFDRRAQHQVQLDEHSRMVQMRKDYLAQSQEPDRHGRSPFLQDRNPEAWAAEEKVKKALEEKRKGLTGKRLLCQRGLVELLRATAGCYREHKGLNSQIATVMIQQNPSDHHIDPLAGPGGQALEGLSTEDRETLAGLFALLRGMSRGKFTR